MKNKELYSGKELYKLALNLSQEYRPNKSSLERRKRDSKFFTLKIKNILYVLVNSYIEVKLLLSC